MNKRNDISKNHGMINYKFWFKIKVIVFNTNFFANSKL